MRRRYTNPISRRMVVSLIVVSAIFVAGFSVLSAYTIAFWWRYVVMVLAMVAAIFIILSVYVRRINKIIGERAEEENAEIRRELTQNIAHELKTPVASIQGYLETILDSPDMAPSTRRQFLERSFAQTRRLTSLLQDISTLNKMDANAAGCKVEMVDIIKMVDTIDKETALQRESAGITFRNLLIPPIIIRGDYSFLYGVFRNLMDNAIAYAGAGVEVRLSASYDGGFWHFVFSDNGTGVPEEHLERLFERFYRVDKGRSRKLGGTGLGLAIVKNAVQMHGGEIHAFNNEGGGLRFEFSLDAHRFDDTANNS